MMDFIFSQSLFRERSQHKYQLVLKEKQALPAREEQRSLCVSRLHLPTVRGGRGGTQGGRWAAVIKT
jgi:hypothetical protein